MSTINMAEELSQRHGRFSGPRPGTKKTHALVAALTVAAALTGCATFQSSDPAADKRITANVQAQIDKHPGLESPNRVYVQTLDHVVYLTGQVGDGLEARIAESIARQTKGVARVENTIYVSK